MSQPICESSPEFSDNKGSTSEEPNVCSIGVEAYTISRVDESVSCQLACQSQFEDRSVNSSERFGSE